MTKQEFQDLLDRYLTGDASAREEQLVEKFYNRLQQTEQGWDGIESRRREELQAEIFAAVSQEINTPKEVKTRQISWGKWLYRVAASVVLVLGLIAFYNYQAEAPQLAYVTKSTGRGQKALITLSDGSTVKLNALSSITYPEPLDIHQRTIVLEGEAFFKVTKDPNRPFVVKAHKIQTTVLGTSFDVNAYDPSSISVSLIEGKVNMEHENDDEVYLNPGERASYTASSGALSVTDFDELKLTAWKDGVIYLEEAGMSEVFDQLSKWYGVDFEFVNQPVQRWDYSGQFKDMSLEVVLNTIGFSESFDFEINEDIVQIKFEN